MTKKNMPEDFWNRVQKSQSLDACWPWLGCEDGHGYGCLKYQGIVRKAHRLAWELANRVTLSNKDIFVCHHCDNPVCCNPAHLWIGSVIDNNRDAMKKNRTCKGSRNANARLKEADIPMIFSRHRRGESQRFIAKAYRVYQSTIGEVLRRESWLHVPINMNG